MYVYPLCPKNIVIIVPSVTPILLLLFPYIIIVRLAMIILWPDGLLYIESRFFHLYHPRIANLCNVKEVSPLKWLISKEFISIFFYFWSWFYKIIITILTSVMRYLQFWPSIHLTKPTCMLVHFGSKNIVIIVTHVTTIVLLLFPYIIIVRLAMIILWRDGLLYIERRFFHLYHPRIFHLYNVKEVSPLKWLISKALISLFFYFWSWFHNKIQKYCLN